MKNRKLEKLYLILILKLSLMIVHFYSSYITYDLISDLSNGKVQRKVKVAHIDSVVELLR